MYPLAREFRIAVLAILLPVLFSCAASTNVSAVAPEIRIEQLPRSEFDVENQGAVSVAYQMVVRNRSTEPITLRQVEMKAIGRSPYSLRNTPASFNETIEPGRDVTVTFQMWAYPRQAQSAVKESVWVRGTAHFETTTAKFVTPFSQSFREPD